MNDRERIAQIIYYGAVLLVGYLSFLIFQPFLVPLGWGAVLAVCASPLHARLTPRVGRSQAALLSTLLVLVLIVVPIWLLVQVLVSEVAQAVTTLQSAAAAPPTPPEWLVRTWHWVQAHVPVLAPERLSASISAAAQQIGSAVAQGSGKLIGGVALLIVDLFIALFALFFFLRDAPGIVRMMRVFLPFDDSQRDHILQQIGDLIYASVIAGLAVAAVQGCLGGLAFWLLGLEAPVVWGTVMAFFALVPVLGAWVVWLPGRAVPRDDRRHHESARPHRHWRGSGRDGRQRPASRAAQRPLVDERARHIRRAPRRRRGVRLHRSCLWSCCGSRGHGAARRISRADRRQAGPRTSDSLNVLPLVRQFYGSATSSSRCRYAQPLASRVRAGPLLYSPAPDDQPRERPHVRNRFLAFAWTLLAVAFLGVAPAMAQTDARIVGTVRDQSGALVRGATVTVVNQGTGQSRAVLSNDDGYFVVTGLKPAVYTVTVVSDGLRADGVHGHEAPGGAGAGARFRDPAAGRDRVGDGDGQRLGPRHELRAHRHERHRA